MQDETGPIGRQRLIVDKLLPNGETLKAGEHTGMYSEGVLTIKQFVRTIRILVNLNEIENTESWV